MKDPGTAARLASLYLSALLLGGCVSASKYKELQAQDERTSAELVHTQDKVTGLNNLLDKRLAEMNQVKNDRDDAKRDLTRAKSDLEQTKQDLSQAQSKVDDLTQSLKDATDKLGQVQGELDQSKMETARLSDELARTVDVLKLAKAAIDKRLEELSSAQRQGAGGATTEAKAPEAATQNAAPEEAPDQTIDDGAAAAPETPVSR